ncbi:MAG: restriction endonuclease [Nitrosopumilus sp. H13]|nr:MAG: restriction endonuclease [Nitrosopumilus sp. H13]
MYNTALSGYETVYLKTLDGLGFEKLCERIFQRLGNWNVERIGGVADAGRDLVIDGPDGRIIVECKHYNVGSIGRPIVQKLHSAVITNGGNKGIIMTTGRYTKSAVEYAGSLKDIKIDLYETSHLIDLAEKAKIRLITKKGRGDILSFPVLTMDKTRRMIVRSLNYRSHPASVDDLLKITPEKVELVPYYMIRASIKRDFTNTVGQLIYDIDEPDLLYIFNAITGKTMDAKHAEFLKVKRLPILKEIQLPDCDVSSPLFRMGATLIKTYTEDYLISQHTQIVRYIAGNNSTYTKKCIPSRRDITIRDTKQVRLPKYYLTLGILSKNYSSLLIQNDTDIMLTCLPIHKCSICEKDVGNKALLCNSCGAISHLPAFFRSHSHICKKCKRTICKKCTFWSRKMLFLKTKMCKPCANTCGKDIKKLT